MHSWDKKAFKNFSRFFFCRTMHIVREKWGVCNNNGNSWQVLFTWSRQWWDPNTHVSDPFSSMPLLFRFILTAAPTSKLHSLLGLTTTYSLVCCLKNASPFPHPDLVFVLFETVIIPFFFYTIRNHMMKRLINGSKVKL